VNAAAHRGPGARGFTLLELLVVLVIVGVTISMISLSIGTRGPQTVLTEQARRLAALIDMAGQQAVMSSEQYGMRFTPHGYEFMVLDEKNWHPVADDTILRPRRLAAGMRLTLKVSGQTVALGAGGDDTKPDVYLYSTGERTPFTATLRIESGGAPVRVVVPFSGRIRVKAAAEPPG